MLAKFDMVRYPEGHLDECLLTLHSYILHTEDPMTRLTLFNHDDIRTQITDALTRHAQHTDTDTTFTHDSSRCSQRCRSVH